ncbi:MAG: RsmB/NOP family class I SAM-dependent RNA methyltransferase [Actinomycetes bacterium]
MTGPSDGRGRPRGAGRNQQRPGPRRRSLQAPSQRARATDPARRVAFDVLRAVSEQDAYANLVLPPALRRARLSGRDAGLATEITYGTLRGRGLYDAILAACLDRPLAEVDPPVLDALRMGTHQLLATRVPQHAAVDQTVALVRSVAGQGAGGFANAVLRRVAEHDPDAWVYRVAPPRDENLVAHLAVATSHPEWIVRAFRESLVAHGRPVDEIDALLAADNTPPRVALALLPGLSTLDDVTSAGGDVQPGRWSPMAAVLAAGEPAGLHVVRVGRARVQDEGSQLAALALAAAPLDGRDARWLDLCAGPGGKAALLAAVAAEHDVSLTAVEVSPHRAELVRQALAPVPGSHEVQVTDGREVGQEEPGSYDRVLVDVPCTGLGALRRRPEARWRRQPSDLASLAPLQRALLSSALDAVRPGGLVAYVTCSPHPAETIAVVTDLARRRDDVHVLDAVDALEQAAGKTIPDLGTAALPPSGPTGRSAQLWPHLHGTDAMFVALLRRPA